MLKLHPFFGALALAAAAGGSTLAAAATPTPIIVKIIGLNDYHGNLESPGTFGANTTIPMAQRPAVGGAEYLAAFVARMKAANPNHVVVGAGDVIGATPLISALFFDEPAVETLNKIGLEFNAVGNHEFDKGKSCAGCKTAAARSPTTGSSRTVARASAPRRPACLTAPSTAGCRPTWSRQPLAAHCCRPTV